MNVYLIEAGIAYRCFLNWQPLIYDYLFILFKSIIPDLVVFVFIIVDLY